MRTILFLDFAAFVFLIAACFWWGIHFKINATLD
jgi:hypothetical protein